MNRYRSRKFIGFLIALTMAFVLALLSKLDGGAFVAILGILVPAYFAADVTQDQLSRRAPFIPDDGRDSGV